VLDQLILLSQI